jgi:hypothetical protein
LWTPVGFRSEVAIVNNETGRSKMTTKRQRNGQHAVDIVRRHAPCISCRHRSWKPVRREQHGVDLQCRACGRLAESKGLLCDGAIRDKIPRVIPGGSFAVRMRQRSQGHRVDLYVTIWCENNDFVVRAIAAEDQPGDLIRPRFIRSGSRAGHIVSDICLWNLGPDIFPVLAKHKKDEFLLPPIVPSVRPTFGARRSADKVMENA